ncbi:jg18239 [Pararge aegeria aegeria]|uniref:Jg18239 protein n=1 Tax=Pararge aegeria aegeria TaxID=348720 RepID=A0A8S4SEA6_9NEOP|nr:jg18239 [Pararge aegeria aegeria]
MKPATDVTEWSKLFPLDLEDFTNSGTFMKKITLVIISSISYLKEALPPGSFTEEIFQGIRLRILRNNCGNKTAQFLSTALEDAFDAMDKRYLHKLALCFYEGECRLGNMLESHVFEYVYNGDMVTMNITCSRDKDTSKQTNYTTEQQTVNLIRGTLVLMRSCQNMLPSTYGLSLRLYYNEDTPDDYHAPGFTFDGDADHFENFAIKGLKVGRVDTPFHKLSLLSYVKEHTSGDDREACLCIFRRTLKFCSSIDCVDVRAVSERFRMSAGNASKLMKMLHRHGIIQQDPTIDSNKSQKVIEKHLKHALIKFSNEREENITDRLIGEIEGALSQESCQSTLIDEVLTPIEKQDLRNTSNLGRLIEKPMKNTFVEDSTLKQYREALVMEEVKDPLKARDENNELGKRESEQTAMSNTGNKKARLQLKYKKRK